MFSLIITIISIALVAVLALATLYYGGDAFNKGTADAQAAKVINQGQQLLAASELYAADAANAGQPMTMARLISGGYLKSVPVAYQGNGSINEAWAASAWAMPTDGQPVFVATLDSTKACQTVNKRSIGEDVLLTQAFPNLLTQCYEGADDQLRAVVSKNASAMAAVAGDAVQTLLPSADVSGTAYAAAGGGGAPAPGPGALQLWMDSDATSSQPSAVTPGGVFVFNSGGSAITLTSVAVQDSPALPYNPSLAPDTVCAPGVVLAPATSCFVNVSISGTPGSPEQGATVGTFTVETADASLSVPVVIPMGAE